MFFRKRPNSPPASDDTPQPPTLFDHVDDAASPDAPPPPPPAPRSGPSHLNAIMLGVNAVALTAILMTAAILLLSRSDADPVAGAASAAADVEQTVAAETVERNEAATSPEPRAEASPLAYVLPRNLAGDAPEPRPFSRTASAEAETLTLGDAPLTASASPAFDGFTTEVDPPAQGAAYDELATEPTTAERNEQAASASSASALDKDEASAEAAAPARMPNYPEVSRDLIEVADALVRLNARLAEARPLAAAEALPEHARAAAEPAGELADEPGGRVVTPPPPDAETPRARASGR